MERLAADSKFAPLAGKVSLGMTANAVPPRRADASFASDSERPVIAEWAAARGECIKAYSRYGNAAYRPPLQAFGIDAENKVMAAAVALYNRAISFGEFDRRRQAVAEELRAKAADLSRSIQLQRTAQEQADRLTREREQTQREIEEAERQATAAWQKAEQAQEGAARLPARAYRQGAPRRFQPAPIVPYRNCFRFGARLTCTGW